MARGVTMLAVAVAFCAIGAAGSNAADLDRSIAAPPPTEGVPCESAEAKSFPSVWLGHFSGGYSQYLGPGTAIVLDWRDEKLCFPSRRGCGRYIASMRRDFHRPEGAFTCLPIR